MSDFLLSWLIAFTFTQCVEMGVYAQAHERARPLRERLAIAFACSAVTHPLVWFVIPGAVEAAAEAAGVRAGYWSMVAVGETWAVVGEAVILWCFAVPRPFLWAPRPRRW